MSSCQGKSGDFFHGKRRGYSNREFWKKGAYPNRNIAVKKNNFSTENPARFLRQVSYTGLEFFRKERRQCQTVRIPGATWMTSSSIRKTADQASDKRKPCRNARPQRRIFLSHALPMQDERNAVKAFPDFLFFGVNLHAPFFIGRMHFPSR